MPPGRTYAPADPDRADPAGPDSYMASCLRLAERRFPGLDLAAVKALEEDFNTYPGLENLAPPRDLLVLEEALPGGGLEAARRAVLEGRVLWEHTAAGEGLRLGLGPKFLLNTDDPGRPAGPGSLTLGDRHLGQWAFEMSRLAREAGLEPDQVLARQSLLLIVSAEGRAGIVERVRRAGFWGLAPENFLFMEQAAFPALRPEGGWHFDEATPRRLHNHGHLAMQKTMDGQIFSLDGAGREARLSRDDFFGRLERADDLVSQNIEDLGYLTRALDLESLGLALSLGVHGFAMTMEIVPNNPEHPVKGGLCAHDPALGRDVMIESFRLRGLSPARLSHLNKNCNHLPRPDRIFGRLREEGLFLPLAVREEGLYFQPTQGDMNFLAPTAFYTRRRPRPLSSWKSAADTPAAQAALTNQDAQPGFTDFLRARLARPIGA